jgi:agmatinase
VAARNTGVSVLQIDAHADLRDSYFEEKHSHACAMRRTLDPRTAGAGGHPQHLRRGGPGVCRPSGRRFSMTGTCGTTPSGFERVVAALSDTVYITIDLDGLDPGLMPAVGTPEPGGLSWRELTALLRRVFETKRVIACDVGELCPIPGSSVSQLHRGETGLQAPDL